MKEVVLVLVKPDAMVKGLAGHLMTRFGESGFELLSMRLVSVSKKMAREHYRHLKDKPFFDEIVSYLQGQLHGNQKVLAMILRGDDAVSRCRVLAGATNPEEAEYQSIRGAFGRVTTKGIFENVIHVSSDPKEAEREIKIWFDPDQAGEEIFPTQIITKKSHQIKAWA